MYVHMYKHMYMLYLQQQCYDATRMGNISTNTV